MSDRNITGKSNQIPLAQTQEANVLLDKVKEAISNKSDSKILYIDSKDRVTVAKSAYNKFIKKGDLSSQSASLRIAAALKVVYSEGKVKTAWRAVTGSDNIFKGDSLTGGQFRRILNEIGKINENKEAQKKRRQGRQFSSDVSKSIERRSSNPGRKLVRQELGARNLPRTISLTGRQQLQLQDAYDNKKGQALGIPKPTGPVAQIEASIHSPSTKDSTTLQPKSGDIGRGGLSGQEAIDDSSKTEDTAGPRNFAGKALGEEVKDSTTETSDVGEKTTRSTKTRYSKMPSDRWTIDQNKSDSDEESSVG